MGKMTVYHGSYTFIENPKIVRGRNTKDFGPGFYCTLIREQAERWAKRYNTPVVNTYTVRMHTSLKILEFREMTEEWLDFINIGKVYKRLILGIVREKGIEVADAMLEAYNSFVSEKIDDYNSSFYYDAPQNILKAFLDGKIE